MGESCDTEIDATLPDAIAGTPSSDPLINPENPADTQLSEVASDEEITDAQETVEDVDTASNDEIDDV